MAGKSFWVIFLKMRSNKHETMMSKGGIYVLLKTIIVLLFVLLSEGAEDPEIIMQKEISDVFSDSRRYWPDIPREEYPFVYKEISEDENYSGEFREYAGKMYRLTVIRKTILDLLQGIHDQKSAESATERILMYDKELAEMNIRRAFIKAKRKVASHTELYVLAHLYEWEGVDSGYFYREMNKCIKDKHLYQYDTLKHELNPRLHGHWNQIFHMPSFYVSSEPIIAAYKEIHEDSTRSVELREFVNRCLKVNDIREKMLEAVSMIHDETSAVKAGEVLTRYNDEIDDMDMSKYYIEIKDKLSKEEQKILDQLLLWRYDEATACMIKYMRIWEEKGLEQYESKVEIIHENARFPIIFRPLWIDYMYRPRKQGVHIEESVEEIIMELHPFTYYKVLAPPVML